MESSTFSRFLVACALLLCSSKPFTGAEKTDLNVSEVQPRLNYLGNVGSKRFYGGDNLNNWQDARIECLTSSMAFATINSTAEFEFLRDRLQYGPFWLGARDIGTRDMYRWSDTPSPPPSTAETIPDYIYFYHSVEDGPMALTMNAAYGPALIGVHSHKRAAKALCQV